MKKKDDLVVRIIIEILALAFVLVAYMILYYLLTHVIGVAEDTARNTLTIAAGFVLGFVWAAFKDPKEYDDDEKD